MTQPLPEQPPVDDAEEQQSLRDRLNDRKVLAAIGGAVVVVAALGLFVVKPMLSGSSTTSSAGPVVHHAVHHPAKPSASPSAPVVAATPAPQLKVRDPFSPLVVPVTAAASPSPTVAAQPSTPTIVVVQPSASPTNATYSLKLDKVVDAKTVQVTLNGNQQTVALGQNFPDAKNGPFALTYVSSASDPSHDSAQFAYGTESFSLAIGETKSES